MAPFFLVEHARSKDISPALRLALQYVPDEARAERVAAVQSLISTGELDPRGIFVAREGNRLIGAVVAIALAGASGQLWSPQVAGEALAAADAVEDALVAAACRWLWQRQVKVLQALLSPADVAQAAPLLRHGFKRITRLHQLRYDLGRGVPNLNSDLSFVSSRDVPAALFQGTLLRTYEQTLDCPELNGVRDVTEVLAGHRTEGEFNPDRWWLVLQGTKPVGVVLTNYMPDWQGWDLCYLGVVPEARRRGLGRQLAIHALREAHCANAVGVSLAVDDRNVPARNLYAALGFEPTDCREVFLLFASAAQAS